MQGRRRVGRLRSLSETISTAPGIMSGAVSPQLLTRFDRPAQGDSTQTGDLPVFGGGFSVLVSLSVPSVAFCPFCAFCYFL